MITANLGRTPLSLSRIGLGLAALGRPGYMNLGHADDLNRNYDPAAMEAHAHEVLDAAWSAGVRYFDAARSYGKAEEFLASWLKSRGHSPEAVTIGSKWGYTYTAGWRVDADKHEIKDHSVEVLNRQFAESRTLLGQHLDLYQIHSATLESGVLGNGRVLDELARIRQSGVAVGLSVTGPRQADVIRKALSIRRDSARLFDSVQATWNLLEQSTGPALQEAHAAGMGVIVKEGLANGRLTGRNTDPAFAEKRRRLEKLAADHGCSLDALALACILAQPWADTVLSGAATIDQLHSNLNARIVAVSGTNDAIKDLAEEPDEYWATRARLAWN